MDKSIFVAEFSINHHGNMSVLLRMVEQAKAAGATYIKMMKKKVSNFYSPEKLATPYNTPFGKTFGEYREALEFGEEDFKRFDMHCEEHEIPWFTTVHDISSLNDMLGWDLPMYKIASCNARNTELIKEVAKSVPHDKTIVLSVGGSMLSEIVASVNLLIDFKRIYILHCVSEYPVHPTRLRLGNIKALRSEFECKQIRIGYSGHEDGILGTFAAADDNVEMIERHFCLSRNSFLHHIECALEPEKFQTMVNIINEGGDKLYSSYSRYLPPAAFDTKFGMTDNEELFLEKQRYGIDFITDKSLI